jgi:hypothetical protein
MKTFPILLALFLAFLSTSAMAEEASVKGNKYDQWLFQSDSDLQPSISLERPSDANSDVQMVVAGAYTSKGGDTEGIIMIDGVILSDKKKTWDGALVINNGEATVISTSDGTILTDDLLKTFSTHRISMIQGHLLVKNGTAQGFKPQQLFQRRAYVVMKDGRTGIIQSQTPLDLVVFASDLVDLGVNFAMNLDMGSWDSGWYKDADQVKHLIGSSHKYAHLQTNWVVIKNNQ